MPKLIAYCFETLTMANHKIAFKPAKPYEVLHIQENEARIIDEIGLIHRITHNYGDWLSKFIIIERD